ncbi:MAG: FtsQ-type POTRA domain-containing protein [Geobacter sp.]|nr:FtsQ-type POTRA domain-containing protein [Geobacter sp.]
MRDLHPKKLKPTKGNRRKRERKPINFRAFFRRIARVVGCIAAVATLGAGSYYGYRCFSTLRFDVTLLRVEKVEVLNARRLTREEVMEQAGVKEGVGMLSLNLRAIGDQLRKNPWLEQVKVRRYFPHTLSIELAEREPVAVVNMNYLYYLDLNGEVFKPLTQGDSLDYPVVTGMSEEELGTDPAGSKAALRSAVEMIALLRKGTDLRLDDISEIHLDKGYGVTLFTANGGVPIKVGIDNFPAKLARLGRIFGELQGQMATLDYIDLNYTDKIIVKKV